MSVFNIKNNTALVIRFAKGQNLDGTPKIAIQKLSNASATATDAFKDQKENKLNLIVSNNETTYRVI